MRLLSSIRYIVASIAVNGQFYTPFEISLPANIKAINGLIITNTVVTNQSRKLGTLCLQSQDIADVFFCDELYANIPFNDDPNYNLEFVQNTTNRPWDTSVWLKPLSLNIGGDTAKLLGWYKAEYLSESYTIKIILQYEEVEKLIDEARL
jgi:hypothetical protein